jgi:HNH endonuclease
MANTYQAQRDFIELLRRYCPELDTRIPAIFFARLPNDPTVCWLWHGYCDAYGYGRLAIGFPRWWLVHRYVCNWLKGAVDRHNVVHHRCGNSACWNPFHLEELTPKEHEERHRKH